MSFQFPSDIQQSISAFIADGSYRNEEEVLRAAIQLLNQQQEDIASIHRGLADIAAGKVVPADSALEAFRRKHDIPTTR